MAKCKICGKAVVTAHVFHRECWQEEVEKLAQVFCDNYCRASAPTRTSWKISIATAVI